jgi:hypothetical protein
MDFVGTIRAKPGGLPLTYRTWCDFVCRSKDLVRQTPHSGRNPFTGEAITINPKPDTATVVLNGKKIGFVEWSQSGEDEVSVWGDSILIVPWAQAVAVSFDANFAEMPIE